MAIKGKNKSKNRGRVPQRRQPVVPRTVAASSHPSPWYRTMGGQLTAIVVLLAIIGIVMWRVSVAKTENTAREARQAALVTYTSEAEDFVDQIQEPVREMLGAPFNTANPEGIAGLTASTERWIEELEKTGALVQALVPPEDLVSLNVVFQQAFLLYGSAAKTYALVPGEETNKRKQEVLTRASELREEAGLESTDWLYLGQFHPDTGRMQVDAHAFFAASARPAEGFAPEEGMDVRHVRHAELKRMILSGEFRHQVHLAIYAAVLVRGADLG